MIKCIFCDGILKYERTGGVYHYYRCTGCRMSYARHKNIAEWIYIENRPWKDEYGNWVVCTKEIEENTIEQVVFT
jgi:hypothetical protein